ncbi:MAG TPA: hypothetical protein VLU43_07505 [Anaeromyxobacteraceae bacterium]|nr:hypothetical protein [Anaeromyxobacteraceae bacterium]
MTARCPSDLALEKLLLARGDPGAGLHVRSCGRCQERLAEMRRQGDEFFRYVFPATVRAVEEAAPARRRRRVACGSCRWTPPGRCPASSPAPAKAAGR